MISPCNDNYDIDLHILQGRTVLCSLEPALTNIAKTTLCSDLATRLRERAQTSDSTINLVGLKFYVPNDKLKEQFSQTPLNSTPMEATKCTEASIEFKQGTSLATYEVTGNRFMVLGVLPPGTL